MPELDNFLPDCGVQGGNRVVGGEEAAENQYPWQCSILNNDNSVEGNYIFNSC